MKKLFLLIIVTLFFSGYIQSFAQTDLHSSAKLKLNLAFIIESGTNGTSVAYDPAESVYYAVIAGNEDFPLEKFDKTGNSLFTSYAGVDVRGMWWNPKSKSLEVNAYYDLGYYKIDFDSEGDLAGSASQIISGQNQPSEQSVASFDSKKQQLFFYYDGEVYTYSLKSGKAGKKSLTLDIPVDLEDINYTTMIYTGVKGVEFGLLDYIEGEVLFFDKKTGKYSGAVNLADDAPLNDSFCFSYANGMVWLYNVDTRTWSGFEIFL